jgi:hypothetical protein
MLSPVTSRYGASRVGKVFAIDEKNPKLKVPPLVHISLLAWSPHRVEPGNLELIAPWMLSNEAFRCGLLFVQSFLKFLCVLEVRDKRRTHLHQQRF